ncbi:MAG TPA: TIGR04282 family arsenosugar biosynthesis glycosyltransferase [Planctomycetia bacterium]|nr:TIGR04282 family arsenosugar biosynthesis glycosyltransferase [Planctomycetia bacterium]
MNGVLLVFLKQPLPGRVKTRLAAELGAAFATACYREMLQNTLEKLQPLRQRLKILGYADQFAPEAFREWDHLVDNWLPQPQGDLGERLAVAFDSLLAEGSVAAIGTDCPELNRRDVESAFASLDRSEAVFGPTPDGGYYLVGLQRPSPGFFSGVRWSTRYALTDQLQRCDERSWRAELLPLRHDIDLAEDWRAWRWRIGKQAQPPISPSSSPSSTKPFR